MSQPLVSVVIAAWNAAEFLPATLTSVMGQTWQHLEVIVVDDGSTDNTVHAIEPFLPRIRYERRSHGGLAAARNEGIRLARGEYLALLDADDIWLPEKIAIQVEILGRHPESGMVACDGVQFEGESVLWPTLLSGSFRAALAASSDGEVTDDFHGKLAYGCGISCPAQVLFPRRVVEEIGPFSDSGVQDYDYYLRVSARHPITLHDHSLVRWRYHAGSMSGPLDERMNRWGIMTLPVLLEHHMCARADCRPGLEAQLRALTLSLGYGLMTRGREQGRGIATARLGQLFRMRPWPPSALVYLVGLWSPHLAFRIGAKLARLFRKS